MENVEKEKKHLSKRKKIIIIILVVLLLVLIGIGAYFLINKLNEVPESESAIEDIQETISVDTVDGVDVIGYLTIESIGLEKAPIKQGTDEETLNTFLGHFTDSAYLSGNVAIAGHNRGYEKNYFENLKNIQEGDLIVYETKYETKTYAVSSIEEIKETNVEVIENTEDNRITLITCVENKPSKRLCVVGLEVEVDDETT